MKRTLTSAALPLTLLAGLALLAPGAAPAATVLTQYRIQTIVKLGDQVADVTIKVGNQGGDLEIGTLNDSGQIAFVTENAAGGQMLLQYTKGQFIPIVVVGRDAPGGKWARGSFGVLSPVSMNQRGNIAFAAYATIGGTTGLGTFRWDAPSQKVTLVAFQGLPAVNNLLFVHGSNSGSTPLINNSEEIAFAADVKNAAGQTRSGVFFLGQGGPLQAIALPDQALPGGATVQNAYPTSLAENGVVAFTAAGSGSQPSGVYLWEKGTITPVAVAGTPFAGLGTVAAVPGGGQVSHKDRSVILPLRFNSLQNPWGEYRWTNGPLTPLFVVGQAMPGGGRLADFWPPFAFNDAGQFAVPAPLSGGNLAAYRMDADGTLALILKTGTSTDLGTITTVGGASPAGIGLNSQGQVALPVRINGGPYTLVLLTPAAP
jgi:hypothetical protein